MSNLDHLLQDGFKSELMLKRHLTSLSEALGRQLQEAERRHRHELERRIHQNTLLSPDAADENERIPQTIQTGLRRSASAHVLASDRGRSRHHPARTSGPTPAAKCERAAPLKPTQQVKDELDEAECTKKFSARPVPGHVGARLYQEMVELRETERRRMHEQRTKLLLALQKPFSFQEREREREKRENLRAARSEAPQDATNKTLRKNKEAEPQPSRVRVEVQTRRPPDPPAQPGPRAAERARREKLGFLDEQPSFRPKIIQRVPDFNRLHRALRTAAQARAESERVATKCQPFQLRTSARPARERKQSQDTPQAPNRSGLARSKSLGALTSLSADTLPTYITDAARKRQEAIRKSMEARDGEARGSADWSRDYQRRSEAMRRSVRLCAKLLDPHGSLREVRDEKLRRHREADQQRMREYTRDLRDMKARVKERPYLFQQVQQRNAMAHAEQTYRRKLRSAGVNEKFVEENGAGGFEDGGEVVTSGEAEEENVDGRGEN